MHITQYAKGESALLKMYIVKLCKLSWNIYRTHIALTKLKTKVNKMINFHLIISHKPYWMVSLYALSTLGECYVEEHARTKIAKLKSEIETHFLCLYT